jgi:hypothetical protein
VNARIIPVGVETTGTMEVPADVRTVGWYRFGPSPALPGSTVLIGHVDSRAAGPGVFSVLTLITCGGSFDSAAGRYTHNVVVTAILRT